MRFSLVAIVCILLLGCKKEEEVPSLENTTWDFTLIHNEDLSWQADVLFKDDGTSVYDEPAFPGVYTQYGTWSLNGNILNYNMDASSTNDSYIFTGTVTDNFMEGTYTWNGETKVWNAVPK